jgi:hypothetical protein
MIVIATAGVLVTRRASADTDSTPSLSLRVEVERGGLKFGLAPGGRLRSGDRLQATISADRDVFVNVVQFFADGSATVLYPLDESGFLRAGSTLRVPREGFWLELDDAVGEEHLYFVVSTRPLGEVDRVIAASIDRVRTSAGGRLAAGSATRVASAGASADAGSESAGPPERVRESRTQSAPQPVAPAVPAAPAVAPPNPRPDGLDLRNRGLVRVSGAEETVVELDADGLVIHRFSFFHDPG